MTFDPERQVEVRKLLRQFTDEELLMELRHRNRLKRIEADHIIEGWRIDHKAVPPDEYIKIRLAQEVGRKIGDSVVRKDIKIPGDRVEEGFFTDFPERSDWRKDKKFVFPLNFVVEL
jgi:hypothetical protein